MREPSLHRGKGTSPRVSSVGDAGDHSKRQFEIRNQQLEGLFKHAPAGIALFGATPPYKVLLHNSVYQEFWPEPFRSEGMSGKYIPEYVPKAEESGILDVFREVARTGEGKTFYNFPYDGMPQGRTWWNWNVSPVIVDDEVVAFAHMLIEVTEQVRVRQRLEEELLERKLLEDALREREERLRLALSAGSMGTWDLDLETEQAFIDAHEAELLGLAPKEQYIHLQEFLDLLHPDDLSRKFEHYDQKEDYDIAFRIIRPDGQLRWIASTTTFIRNENGEATRALGVNFDITERKRYEATLQEAKEVAEMANRAKNHFLANMSHEVRTPLTSIIGFTSLLARRLSGKEREYVKRIEYNGKRLLKTLDSMLTLARLESDTLDLVLEPVNMAAEVKRVVNLLRPKAREKGIDITQFTSPKAKNAHAQLDTAAFHSIIENLISNAIKFTEGGSISVDTFIANDEPTGIDGPEQQVCVRVTDTGRGIDEQFLPYLFESFEQESTGMSREYEGSGLGLTITKQLVDRMGGSIEVESEKGQGSTFVVAFPRVKPSTPSVNLETSHSTSTKDLPEANILVVEDDEGTSSLLEDLLSEFAHPTVVDTPQEALEQAGQMQYDLVLVDIELGTDESGIDLLHQLRSHLNGKRTPIVALTAHALPGDHTRFLKEGFDAYLSKPFDIAELLTCVREQLQ